MKFSSFRYLVKQGWHNMLANRLMTFASIGVLTACLVITGVAALLAVNVNSYVDYMGSQNEVEVFLNDIDEATTADLQSKMSAVPNVAECVYISKSQAVLEMMTDVEEYAAIFESYAGENNPENPLPASLRLTIADVALLNETVAEVQRICGENMMDIRSPSVLSDILISLRRVVTYVGWGLVSVLGLVSVVVISNTIRLTVFARRKEINIMKFVGATNAFIRLPFFVEGMTVGAISGLVATGLVGGAYWGLLRFVAQSSEVWLSSVAKSMLSFNSVCPVLLGGFVLFGIFIGGIGCITSIRKHLKV